ncbi:MAG: diacylglycerol/lipid kinase family protein [Oscillospiraceae bacterium]|jgi:diacylglycerol kinase (ATP)
MDGKKRMLFVINPKAGVAAVRENVLDIIGIYCRAGYDVSTYVTEKRKDATQYVTECGADYDIIVVCGGDGTMHEVADGILNLDYDKRPPLGVMPGGSVNDFASTLGMPDDLIECAKRICNGKVIYCDAGMVNEYRFIYCTAFGWFTEISFETPQYLKNAIGNLAYALQGIKDFPSYRYRRIKVEYDDGTIEGDYAIGVVSNTTSIAGMRKLFDHVSELNDGKLELMLIRFPNNIADFTTAMNIINQREKLDPEAIKGFGTLLKTSWARITCESPTTWLADGEDGGTHESAEIKVLKGALPVITN